MRKPRGEDRATGGAGPRRNGAGAKRAGRLRRLAEVEDLDLLIIGGGISGAPVYHELSRRGFRVALVDRGDFGCGTSQASGMLVWGGLLYLQNLDLLTVRKLCRARDRWIATAPEQIARQALRYLPSRAGRRSAHLVQLALWLYWLLGARERIFPRRDVEYRERGLMRAERFGGALLCEEATLRGSDARFVLDWIRPFDGEGSIPVNYCEVVAGGFDRGEHRWRLDLRDRAGGAEVVCRPKLVINCAGVWTDEVNRLLGIESPYRHVCSKGVFLGLPRQAEHEDSLVVDMGKRGDVQTYLPWGPIALWGPTETTVTDPEGGFRPDVEDLRFLLAEANRNLKRHHGPGDIVSVRCGVRPLAVKKSHSRATPSLKLSRRYMVARDRERNALAVYGGKLTACGLLAEQVAAQVERCVAPAAGSTGPREVVPEYTPCTIVGEPRVSARWSRDHEFCLTLDDYLRRRTNIAQWTPRRGWGDDDEHRGALLAMAREFTDDDPAAERMLDDYRDDVHRHHDQLLASI
jgi:glycerol-3-phosphate dehydrogenase